MAIQHFLLVFDHERGMLIEEQDFGTDAVRAVAAYSACEKKHQDSKSIEIVLIGSDSIETVQLTHANYFNGTVAISPYLVGL